MTKLSIHPDCSNAPRKELIRDLNIVFAENRLDEVAGYMTDDIEWNIVGERVVKGRAAVKRFLKTMGDEQAIELIVDNIITHGDSAAANGQMNFKGQKIAFCDIYEFGGSNKDAKIKRMTSYAVEVK